MGCSPVELTVGGKTYRVVASAEPPLLEKLASVVDSKLRELAPPERPIAPQTMLLVALALAHDLEEERSRRLDLEQRARQTLTSVLKRIDTAIEEADATLQSAPTDSTQPDSSAPNPP